MLDDRRLAPPTGLNFEAQWRACSVGTDPGVVIFPFFTALCLSSLAPVSGLARPARPAGGLARSTHPTCRSNKHGEPFSLSRAGRQHSSLITSQARACVSSCLFQTCRRARQPQPRPHGKRQCHFTSLTVRGPPRSLVPAKPPPVWSGGTCTDALDN